MINEQDEINQLSIKAQQVKALNPQLKSMIEIESIAQLEQYNLESFDYILLDNFNLKDLPKAISFCRSHYPQIEIEISGNVSLDNIHNYSHFDIDRISVGSLTHSVKSFDISLLID